MGETGVTPRVSGTIRIVGGTMRGRRLFVPRKSEVRPTGEMVREAVFDVLGSVKGLRALDLFAGTGALGLEAVSRGARECMFLEADPIVAKTLRRNIAALGYDALCAVLVSDCERGLVELKRREETFDLLFVDPPYRMLAEVEVALTPLIPSLVLPEGLVVSEGPRLLQVTFGQPVVFEREYGDTRITMVRVRRSVS